MNASYTVSLLASDDIEQIIDYIAQDNVNAAIAFERELFEAFDLIAHNPRIGYMRPEIATEPIRFWVFRKRYLIAYQQHSPIEIVRVLSGYQNLLEIFTS